MNRFLRIARLALSTALAGALFALSGGAAAQQLTGNIYGYVADEQGGRLPGVAVTLSGPGAPQTQTSDARGEYRFLNLSPGSYTLSYELQGFTKVTKPDVQVAVGQNTNTSAQLKLSSVEATVTVRGEPALLDTRRVGTGAVVDQTQLREIPTARDPWVILQTVAGVQTDRLNIGGNESGQQTNYVGKGASGDQNVWNIDGVTITDMGALGSSPTYYDFDSFEEINASTGGSDVTSQTPGVQLNLVTKRGTNELHGSARLFLAQEEWQSQNLPAEAERQGVGPGNRIDEVQDYGVEVGGPIWKDRAWLWGSYGRNQIDLRAITGASDKTTLENTNGKLNLQILEGTAAAVTYTEGNKIKLGRNVSVTRPPPASWNQDGPTDVYKGELSQVFGSKLFATASYSYVSGGFGLHPQGGLDVNNLFIDANGVFNGSYLDYFTVRPQHQAGANGSFFFNTGELGHELKFGFTYRNTPVQSFSTWPGNGNLGFDRANFGTDFDQALLTRRAVVSGDLTYYSGYLSDTLTIGNFTVNAGARYDLQRGNNKGSFTPENPVIPDILPAIQGAEAPVAIEWEDVSPRVGLTYALGAEKKTVARASYARYADQLGIAPIFLTNPGALSGIYFPWNDVNGDRVITRDELDFSNGPVAFYGFDPDNPGSAVSPNRIGRNFDAGQTDEIIVGLDREVIPEFVVGLNYTYRYYDGQLYPRRNGLSASDFVLCTQDDDHSSCPESGFLTGTLADGSAFRAPVYRLADGVEVPAGITVENRPDYHTTYHGVSLNLQKRLSNRWLARGNFTWQDWKQHGGLSSCYEPTNNRGGNNNLWPGTAIGLPTGATCTGTDIAALPAGAASGAKAEVFINSRWQFNLAGVYQLPLGFSVGANFFGREGYPMVNFYRIDPGDGLGSRDVIIGKLGDVRYDDVFNLDARIEKTMRVGQQLQVALSLDVFNVLNDNTVLQRNANVSQTDTYNQIREIQSPRVLRAGARVSF